MASSDSESDFDGFNHDDIARAAANHRRRMDSTNGWSDISLSDYDSEPDDNFESDDDRPLLPPAVAAMQWRSLGFTPLIRQPFTGPMPGATTNLDANATELDFFNLFVSRATLMSFVAETNAYAARKQRLNGQDQNWIDVTYSEMCAFLGLRVYMSVLVLPTLDMYWSKDFMFGNTFAVKVMKRDRFDKISSYFHVADTTLNPPRGQPGGFVYLIATYLNRARTGPVLSALAQFWQKRMLKQMFACYSFDKICNI